MATWQTREPRWRKRLEQMNPPVEDIHFSAANASDLAQDEEWAEVTMNGRTERFRLHDYDAVYSHPGLYELLIYDRLQCCSPSRIAMLLESVMEDASVEMADLRILDIGAGNGMAGDELAAAGAGTVVGLDIVPEARDATLRDRPGVYEDYLVADLTDLSEQDEQRLRGYDFNTLCIVGALGFGDIPVPAFAKALDLTSARGWLAFNIEEGLLEGNTSTAFGTFVDELCQKGVLRYWAYRRYRHRMSIGGEPIYYMAVVAEKLRDLPDGLLPH